MTIYGDLLALSTIDWQAIVTRGGCNAIINGASSAVGASSTLGFSDSAGRRSTHAVRDHAESCPRSA